MAQKSADLRAILVVCYNDLPPVAPLKGGRFDCGILQPCGKKPVAE